MNGIEVDPYGNNNTHNISLDDGYHILGFMLGNNGEENPLAITESPLLRTALQTSTGNQTYGDLNKPWAAVAQDSFAGGIGNLNLEEAENKYISGVAVNTMHTKIVLSGERKYSTGIRKHLNRLPGSVTWFKFNTTANNNMAIRVVGTEAFPAVTVDLVLRKVGNPTDLTITYCQDDAGYPGTPITTKTWTNTDQGDLLSKTVRMTVSDSITIGLIRWIVLSANSDPDNYWMLSCNKTRDTAFISANGTDWNSAPFEPYYIIKDADATWYPIFFDYKYMKYLCVSTQTGNPTLYSLGWRGKASPTTEVNALTDTTQAWVSDELVGQKVYIYAGKGSKQALQIYTIMSNTATRIVLHTNSMSSFDATTEYVIVGGNKWNPVTGHGMTGICSDVIVQNEVIYFALGEDVNMVRGRWTASALYEFAADGTNKAYKLCIVREPAGTKIWRAVNSPSQIAKAPTQLWGTSLTFATALEFSDYKFGRITKVVEYGTTVKTLWVMREGLTYTVDEANKIERFSLEKISLQRAATNGRAAIMDDIYLYFNWGPTIYRWYGSELKDFGPVADEGMPADVQGYCSQLIASPGILFAAYCPYDSTDYATIYAHNGIGWAEIYRSLTPGTTILDISFEVVEGGPNRLLIVDGNDVLSVPMPSRTLKSYKDPLYTYFYEGALVSSYYAVNMYNIYKLYNSVSIFARNLSENTWIELDYQLDEDTVWTPVKEFFKYGPVQEVSLRSSDSKIADTFIGITGKQFRYRIRMYTTDNTITPIVNSVVIEAISRVPIKYSFTATLVIANAKRDMTKTTTESTAADYIAQLKTWAKYLTPLRLKTIYPEMNDVIVFIDAPTVTPTAVLNNQVEVTIAVMEL